MNKLSILKLGGKVLEDEDLRTSVLKAFAHTPGHKILVHGGGKKADELCGLLAIPTRMHQGRRITDEATLEIVTMVYAGLINKQLVATLQSFGNNALGMSGADGNAIQAVKRPVADIDYGFAGDVSSVNADWILQLLQSGLLPVFCSITHDRRGQLLNTNADTISSEIAKSMAPHFSVDLLYCFEKEGVLDSYQKVIPRITWKSFQLLKEESIITDGMIPKLDNAFGALNAGVNSVVIGAPEVILNGGGTRVVMRDEG